MSPTTTTTFAAPARCRCVDTRESTEHEWALLEERLLLRELEQPGSSLTWDVVADAPACAACWRALALRVAHTLAAYFRRGYSHEEALRVTRETVEFLRERALPSEADFQ